jgi:hypothetical protein
LHDAYQAYSAPPEKSPRGPVSIRFSSADRQAYVYRNGVEIGGAQIGGVDAAFPSGKHVYSPLAATDPDEVTGTRKPERLSFAGQSPAHFQRNRAAVGWPFFRPAAAGLAPYVSI